MNSGNISDAMPELKQNSDASAIETVVKHFLACSNMTSFAEVVRAIHDEQEKEGGMDEATIDRNSLEQQNQALAYIIVVVAFYSLVIVVVMVKYMRDERQEMLENQMYREYWEMKRNPPAFRIPPQQRYDHVVSIRSNSNVSNSIVSDQSDGEAGDDKSTPGVTNREDPTPV